MASLLPDHEPMANLDSREKGWFQVPRSLFESELWHMPAYYLKIWLYLQGSACHTDQHYDDYSLTRGQCFRSYAKIADQLVYYQGNRPVRLSVNHVKRAMNFLRKTRRITTAKKPRGVVITVLDYPQLHAPRANERTNGRTALQPNHEPTANQSRSSIYKKEENEKNEKTEEVGLREKIVKHLESQGVTDGDAYLRKIESKVPWSAIKKAWKDWGRGNGIETPGDFYGRCMEYGKREQEETSPSTDAEH